MRLCLSFTFTKTNMNCTCMHVLTACSRHFLVEYCRGWEFAHFECWLMGRLSTLFAFPECWVRDLLLFPYERPVSGRCDLHHLGATEWTGTDVMPPLCGELKSGEGSSIRFFSPFSDCCISRLPLVFACLHFIALVPSLVRISYFLGLDHAALTGR